MPARYSCSRLGCPTRDAIVSAGADERLPMPSTASGNTVASVYGIAERAASLLQDRSSQLVRRRSGWPKDRTGPDNRSAPIRRRVGQPSSP